METNDNFLFKGPEHNKIVTVICFNFCRFF